MDDRWRRPATPHALDGDTADCILREATVWPSWRDEDFVLTVLAREVRSVATVEWLV